MGGVTSKLPAGFLDKFFPKGVMMPPRAGALFPPPKTSPEIFSVGGLIGGGGGDLSVV